MTNRRDPGDGSIRVLKSGKVQARFTYPDGQMRPAPQTFTTKEIARGWLAKQRNLVATGEWQKQRRAASVSMSFEDYADTWVKNRMVGGRRLADRTRDGYEDLLKRFINPEFGNKALHSIAREDVDRWYSRTATNTPTYRARAYSLLRTILASAVDDDYLDVNPARIRGAGSSPRKHQTRILEEDELDAITEAIPPRYRALVQLAFWTGLRYGELTELRRKDLDMKRHVVHVRRAVVLVKGEFIPKAPKSAAGVRDIDLVPELLPWLRTHLLEHAAPGPEGLLFPSRNDPKTHLRQSALTKVFYPARERAGRPDFRWHDFRHTFLTNYAQTGATLAEIQAQGGHSTVTAAMRYQDAADKGRSMRMKKMSKQSNARRRAAVTKAAQAE